MMGWIVKMLKTSSEIPEKSDVITHQDIDRLEDVQRSADLESSNNLHFPRLKFFSHEVSNINVEIQSEDKLDKDSDSQTMENEPCEDLIQVGFSELEKSATSEIRQLNHPPIPRKRSPNPSGEFQDFASMIEEDPVFRNTWEELPGNMIESVGIHKPPVGPTLKFKVKRITANPLPNLASPSPILPWAGANRQNSPASLEQTPLSRNSEVESRPLSLNPPDVVGMEKEMEGENTRIIETTPLTPKITIGRGRKSDISTKELDSLEIDKVKLAEVRKTERIKDRLRSATPAPVSTTPLPLQVIMTDPNLIEERLTEILVGRVKEIPIIVPSDTDDPQTPNDQGRSKPETTASRIESPPLKLRVPYSTTRDRILAKTWTTIPQTDVPRYCYGRFVNEGGSREHRLARGLPLPLDTTLALFVVDSAQFRGNGNLWLSGWFEKREKISVTWLADPETNVYFVREYRVTPMGPNHIEFPNPEPTKSPSFFSEENPGYDMPLEWVHFIAQGLCSKIRKEDRPTAITLPPEDHHHDNSSTRPPSTREAPKPGPLVMPPFFLPPPPPPPSLFPSLFVPPPSSFAPIWKRDNPRGTPQGTLPSSREERRERGRSPGHHRREHHYDDYHHDDHHSGSHRGDYYHHHHHSYHRDHHRRNRSEDSPHHDHEYQEDLEKRPPSESPDRDQEPRHLWHANRSRLAFSLWDVGNTENEKRNEQLFSSDPPAWLQGGEEIPTVPRLINLKKGDGQKSSRKSSHKRSRRGGEEGEGLPPPPPPPDGGGGGEEGGGGQDGNNPGGQGDGGGGDDPEQGREGEEEEEQQEDSDDESSSDEDSEDEESSDEEEGQPGIRLGSPPVPRKKEKRRRSPSNHSSKRKRPKSFGARLYGPQRGYLEVLSFLTELGISPEYRRACQASYKINKGGPKIAKYERIPSVEEDDQHLGRLYCFGNMCPTPKASTLPGHGIPEDILRFLNVTRKPDKADQSRGDWIATYKTSRISPEALKKAAQRSFPSFFPKIRSQGARATVPDDAALIPLCRTLEASINRLFGIISAVWMGDAELAVTLATDSLAVLLAEWKKVILLRATESERKALLENNDLGEIDEDTETTSQNQVVVLRMSPGRLGESTGGSNQNAIPNPTTYRPEPPAINAPSAPPPPTMNPAQSIPMSILGPILTEWANARSPRPYPKNTSSNRFFRSEQSGRSPRSWRKPTYRSHSDRDRKGGK
jgi:hypothetical protein